MLLVVGDDRLRHQTSQAITSEATPFTLTFLPEWGPSTHVKAIAHRAGYGFLRSKAQELHIRPIDKLLRVAVISEHDDMPEEATIEVRNWRGEVMPGLP